MITVDYSQIEITRLITHHIGNPMREEELILSKSETVIDKDTQALILTYFLRPMKAESFYAFQHSVDLSMNEIYSLCQSLFHDQTQLLEISQHISKLLYEQSNHPKIKQGELNVVYFSNIILGDELVDAIGIYKSENDVPFLKMERQMDHFNIQHEYGFEIKGMDKGCLIFNTEKSDGYRLLIVDNANKSAEAVYWKDDFLKVKPVADEYYQTSQFLSMTKHFATREFAENFDAPRADQIDLLNRSVQYFKDRDIFEQKTFEEEVLQQPEVIDSFRNFDQTYTQENNIDRPDQFEISTPAVKKQSRYMKSVLKLDKNFHVYIHGDRQMIERGVEEDGRKYYKLYYEEEK